ncbi:MAG: glycoside hydrolase 43 family protein [Sphingobacterium sp.]|jgi:beta-xylosidase|uniref:glycoside hydrolase family 43 protein n=1 Tax=Sphingobacterium sp. TaxID=341027 RepID=UPI00284DF94D|nr:glycoside hydrolase 43 family protein [Sphingobacterium sp.]MDR3007552.1 glycoside hydrolase 43 family protein [Sphingobacterium sp.]
MLNTNKKKWKHICLMTIMSFCSSSLTFGQHYNSKVWSPDLGYGKFKNPIINADYSDPDVIRVGEDYYMISSSFNHSPGLPILHSKDMINWTIIGHALQRQLPEEVFNKVQHGGGVWAPSIRYHNGEYYIYYPDPDFGIYQIKTKNIRGKWSAPILVFPGKGLIDPCPFWDEDGRAYLAYAYAGSRAGLKSVLAVAEMDTDGNRVLDRGTIVYDGHELDPTIEGPKVYKRNGYYYLFAPAGGVSTGWQLILRSKSIYGPYERKVAMAQNKSAVNGPHQGAWVDTPSGEDWFFHFQDKEAMGRVVHLQPMVWKADWPIIGEDIDGNGVGTPVMSYKKPNVGKQVITQMNPQESDEFDSPHLGLQWQWQANPDGTWLMPSQEGKLRLYSQQLPEGSKNLMAVPNILTQKFPAENFSATAKIRLRPSEKELGEKAGLVVVGEDYSQLFIRKEKGSFQLYYGSCASAYSGTEEQVRPIATLPEDFVYLRVQVKNGKTCNWTYSLDGKKYTVVENGFQAKPGKWIGATLGLYASREKHINDSGYAEVDWFRIDQ